MPYTLLSDEELFTLVRTANDQQAFQALYRRYDKRVYAYCLRALGGVDDAQDVFQIVAMTIYDKRDRFIDGSFAAWLFTITRNMCLKAIRNRKHTVELNDEVYSPETDETHSQDFVLTGALHDAIAQLPEEFREALQLKYYDDLPYEDVAATLGITLSLAKVRVFRAKKLLQKILSPILDELR